MRLAKLGNIARQELQGFHPALLAAGVAARLLPPESANGLRAALLVRAGFEVGAGTRIHGWPKITGSKGLASKLSIGRDCVLEVGLSLDLEEAITLGDGVTLGHQVMILTSSHDLGPRDRRAGPVTRKPVRIGRGAWLGARCIVLPGVTIGEGAVVAPGSLVTKDVLAHTRVGGVPARQLEALPPP